MADRARHAIGQLGRSPSVGQDGARVEAQVAQGLVQGDAASQPGRLARGRERFQVVALFLGEGGEAGSKREKVVLLDAGGDAHAHAAAVWQVDAEGDIGEHAAMLPDPGLGEY